MAVDRWFVGGGAQHTPESARRLTYANCRGNEGIINPGDMKVHPLSTPGQGVRVVRGSGYIRSRYVGGEDQAYQATITSQETVTTTPTGSGGGRTDLVILRVEDPFAAGSPWSAPSSGNIATAPYIHVRVITGVPSSTRRIQQVAGYQNTSAITLARITYPASTGTVTAGMITDLREVANPKEQSVVRAFGIGGATPEKLTGSAAYPGGETWPDAAEHQGELMFEIPDWAVQMSVILTISGIQIPTGTGDANGWFWFQLGANAHANVKRSEPTRWDIDQDRKRNRFTAVTADTISIPAAMRGTDQRIYPRGNKIHGTNNDTWIADNGTSMAIQVVFRQVRE